MGLDDFSWEAEVEGGGGATESGHVDEGGEEEAPVVDPVDALVPWEEKDLEEENGKGEVVEPKEGDVIEEGGEEKEGGEEEGDAIEEGCEEEEGGEEEDMEWDEEWIDVAPKDPPGGGVKGNTKKREHWEMGKGVQPGKPVEEGKNLEEGKPVEEDKAVEEGKPVEEEKAMEEGKPVEEEKVEEGKAVEEEKAGKAVKAEMTKVKVEGGWVLDAAAVEQYLRWKHLQTISKAMMLVVC